MCYFLINDATRKFYCLNTCEPCIKQCCSLLFQHRRSECNGNCQNNLERLYKLIRHLANVSTKQHLFAKGCAVVNHSSNITFLLSTYFNENSVGRSTMHFCVNVVSMLFHVQCYANSNQCYFETYQHLLLLIKLMSRNYDKVIITSN